jgi:hypothetical protein
MGYGSISGRAKTDANNPKAFAVCDRCARWYNHSDLHWQYDYRGRTLANLRILVCDDCYDDPQPQLKPRIIPPDPVAIQNARVEYFDQYNTNVRLTNDTAIIPTPTSYADNFWTGIPVVNGDTRITQNSNTRVTQQSGGAPGSRSLVPGVRFTVPGDGADDVPPNSLGIPETGHIVEQTTYDVWTNDPVNPMYWVNDDDEQVYWNEPPPNTPIG